MYGNGGLVWNARLQPKILALRSNVNMNDEATYICDNCGEEIVVPIDPSAGPSQQYVEDCPVCCAPSVINVEIDAEGDIRIWGEAEQDRF